MRSSSREEVVEVFDALEAGFKRALDLRCDATDHAERLAVLQTLREDPPLAAGHRASADQSAQRTGRPGRIGRETGRSAGRPAAHHPSRGITAHYEAADLGERAALNGEALAPVLEATAAGQRNGDIGTGHVAVIRSFWHRLPDFVDIETRAKAEAQLARLAAEHRPDELARLADTLTDCLNPDGDFTDTDRARRRGLTIGKQDLDGMSPISGYLTPEARATIDAVFAKLAAPGMCNSADDEPCVRGTPSQAAIQGDTRTAAQRNHDALLALTRHALASGDLGQHNGLPASIIVTTTLKELEKGAGRGLTGGGTLLPMSTSSD